MNFRSGSTPRSRQQGNTLVGIIIGLVVGLVIAVIVALMITKGSNPFTDKGKASRASEPAAGQISDPNKPMYGNKEAAREAARDLQREQPKAEAPAAPAAAAPSPADQLQAVVDKIQGQDAKPAPKASNVTPTPPAKAAEAKTADTKAADAGDEKYIYYLQAGAFREIADAESVRAKLALIGYEANISDRATDSGVLHRVRIGPFTQVEAMNKVRSKLSENGVDMAVVRNQK
ncbi:SPOR domain-containing protein [Oxalobacteraceae bacterium A2-2]